VIDYVLGKNEFNHTFLHGFKGDMTFRIHHRNAMGRDDNPPSDVKNKCDYMFASGGLIGGPSASGSFSNIIEGGASFTETEGGCDYNAPFVAAIASIVAELDPVETETGVAEPVFSERSFSVYPTAFDSYIAVDMITHAYDGKASAELVTVDGRVVMRADISNRVSYAFATESLPAGLYFVRISCGGRSVVYKVVK